MTTGQSGQNGQPAQGSQHRSSGREKLAFVASTLSLVALFSASSSPIPLFNTYRHDFGFSVANITMAVVAYFAGTITALLFLGRLAGHVGRRPVAVATLVMMAVGCLVLDNIHGLATLLLGRLAMGLGAGLASSALTAYIVDSAPSSPAWLASVASSQAPNLGLAVGAVGAGSLVEYAPLPTHLVYRVMVGWVAVCIALVLLSAETVPRTPGALASVRPRVHLPSESRRVLPAAAAVFVGTWALGAFYQGFVPSLVAEQLHTGSSLVFGLVFCSYMLPNVMGAPVSGRFSAAGAQRIGMAVFLLGVAGIVAGVVIGSMPVFVAGSLVGGAGQGVAMAGAVRGVLGDSDASERAGIFAAIYLISYGGAAVCTLASGQVSRVASLPTITVGYGCLALLATAFVLLRARD